MNFVFLMVLCVLLMSCGADEEAAFEVNNDKAPVISIEKISQEIDEDRVTVSFKIVADTQRNNDIVVRFSDGDTTWANGRFGYGCTWSVINTVEGEFDSDDFRGGKWIMIPMGKKESKPVDRSCHINSHMTAVIRPLPIITVVGEGDVIDQEFLQNTSLSTEHDENIPKGYVFPWYEVADTKSKSLYVPKAAKIISVHPPSGSELRRGRFADSPVVEITFDTVPECPTILGFSRASERIHGPLPSSHPEQIGTTFYVKMNGSYFDIFHLPVAEKLDFTIDWGSEKAGTGDSQSFEYTLIHLQN